MSVTRNGGAGETLWPLYAVRIYKQGNQLVFPIYKQVVAALEAKAGDLLLVRVHLPYVTFRIAHASLAMPVEHFDPAQLPPTYAELLAEIGKLLA